MTTFTIDEQNNITAFASQEEAAAATTTPFDSFSTEQELTDLIAVWPAERLLAVWNSLPGVTPVKKFKNSNAAAGRILARLQDLGDAVKQPEEPPTKPKAAQKATSAKGGAKNESPRSGPSALVPKAPQAAAEEGPAQPARRTRRKQKGPPEHRKPARRARAARCPK